MKSSSKVLYKLQVTPQSHDGMNNKLASLTVQLEHSTRLQRAVKGTAQYITTFFHYTVLYTQCVHIVYTLCVHMYMYGCIFCTGCITSIQARFIPIK